MGDENAAEGKKILISMPTLGSEGILTIWLRKFKHLQKLGCELDLFGGTFCERINLRKNDVYTFNQTHGEIQRIKKIEWTKWKYLAYSFKRNLHALFTFRKYIKKDYNLIYTPSSALDFVIFPYRYKLAIRSTKWVTVFDNIVPFSDPGNKLARLLAWLFFRLSLILLKKADVIFAISEELRDFLTQRGFSESKIVLSTNGIESDLIRNAVADENLNIDALFVGRINETKGIYDMLKVLDMVQKKYPAFQLAMMGEGDETTKRQFKKKIKEMDLEGNVQFLGYKSGQEKFNILKSAKCFWFLSVSESESFGIALLEAVCSGIPAFTYDLPQFSRIYQRKEISVSPKGNCASVAKAVIRLFEKNNFANDAGKQLLGKYSWEKVAETEYEAMQNL